MTPAPFGRLTRTFLGALVAVSAAACALPGSPVSPETISTASSPLNIEANTAYCVSEINRYRASVGDRPLHRTTRIDAFSAEAARVDGESRRAHQHFFATNGGPNVARAQNVIPFWQLSRYGSVQRIIREGLAMMWAEGSGGSHHDIMRGAFSEVGCGVYIAPNGEVTVSQNYK